jgi:hypothetical protein
MSKIESLISEIDAVSLLITFAPENSGADGDSPSNIPSADGDSPSNPSQEVQPGNLDSGSSSKEEIQGGGEGAAQNTGVPPQEKGQKKEGAAGKAGRMIAKTVAIIIRVAFVFLTQGPKAAGRFISAIANNGNKSKSELETRKSSLESELVKEKEKEEAKNNKAAKGRGGVSPGVKAELSAPGLGVDGLPLTPEEIVEKEAQEEAAKKEAQQEARQAGLDALLEVSDTDGPDNAFLDNASKNSSQSRC